MDFFKLVVSQLIECTPEEWNGFSSQIRIQEFKKNAFLAEAHRVPDEVFFIERGLIRVLINDSKGMDHTFHFATENQFIADYASYLRMQPAHYSLQALEDTRVVVIPRAAIDWGYAHMRQGEKLGRLAAEQYFSYHDDRIKQTFSLTPKERFDKIEEVFPGILNRIPQHMIASYLGISSVHLSRLKNQK
ncbi:MAG: Crp/Fnr family transcriptional regulator [Bacteroidetes bacterium]|nr:Crp/Fnr family transcriptional regulator [Bacteroidota bacterium]